MAQLYEFCRLIPYPVRAKFIRKRSAWIGFIVFILFLAVLFFGLFASTMR